MTDVWIHESGLTGLAGGVSTISDELTSARASLAGSGVGDLGWLADRYTEVTDHVVDALSTAAEATTEVSEQITQCHDEYRESDGRAELSFSGLDA